MAHKTNCNLQYIIRSYKPTDKAAVISLFRFGILEHIYPAFFKAMSHSDHIGMTLSVSVAGYVLGGSSYLQALLFGGAWVSLIYYCCYEIYNSYLKRGLQVEMSNIQSNFLDNHVNHFWVAETEVNGRSKVAGLLAVVSVKDRIMCDRNDGWNANTEDAGSIIQLVVSFPQRRKGLGTQLAETAIEFFKEQGFSRVVVDISSPQTAAISLFRKLGFTATSTHNTHSWILKLARVNIIRLEKYL